MKSIITPALAILFSVSAFAQDNFFIQYKGRNSETSIVRVVEQKGFFNNAPLRGVQTDTILNLLTCDTIFYLYAFHPPDEGLTGYLSGHNSDLDFAKAEYYDTVPGDTIKGLWMLFGKATYTNAVTQKIHCKVWKADGPMGTPGTILANMNVTHKTIADDIVAGNPTTVYFDSPIVNPGPVYVGFEMDYKIENSQHVYSAARIVALANPDIEGDCADDSLENSAWEKYSDGTWHSYWDSYQFATRNPIFLITSSPGCDISIAPSSASVCKGENISLNATGSASAYEWSPGTNLNTPTGPTVIANPKTTTTYTVTGDGGLCSSEVTITVNAKPKATVSAEPCSGGAVELTCIAEPDIGVKYQWKKDGTKINGASNPVYIATSNGSFKCKVTILSTGCEKNSNSMNVSTNCKVSSVLPIPEYGVFPNPFSETAVLSLNTQSNSMITLEVYDAYGRLIETKEMNTEGRTEIGTNYLPGIYFVRVKQGISIRILRVVKV